mgnify:CR=1 FL=1
MSLDQILIMTSRSPKLAKPSASANERQQPAATFWFGHRHREQAISIWTRIAHLGDAIEHSQGERNSKPRSPIPDHADVHDYRSYLAKDRQTYLSPDEILRPHFKYRSGVCSGVPPKHLWPNMVRTARVANEIRNRLGVRLDTVVSAYRSPAYNSRCPGASKYSQHLQNRALDLIIRTSFTSIPEGAMPRGEHREDPNSSLHNAEYQSPERSIKKLELV